MLLRMVMAKRHHLAEAVAYLEHRYEDPSVAPLRKLYSFQRGHSRHMMMATLLVFWIPIRRAFFLATGGGGGVSKWLSEYLIDGTEDVSVEGELSTLSCSCLIEPYPQVREDGDGLIRASSSPLVSGRVCFKTNLHNAAIKRRGKPMRLLRYERKCILMSRRQRTFGPCWSYIEIIFARLCYCRSSEDAEQFTDWLIAVRSFEPLTPSITVTGDMEVPNYRDEIWIAIMGNCKSWYTASTSLPK